MPVHRLTRAMEPAETELFNLDAECIAHLGDSSNEDLRFLSTMDESPDTDGHIELYIYARLLVFTREHSLEYLNQAIHLTERWIAAVAPDDHDRARRLQILDMLSSRATQLDNALNEAEPGNRIYQPSTDELDDMIGRAGRIFVTYQQTGVRHDLDEAIRMTEQAIDVAPRSAALTNLVLMLDERFDETDSTDDLTRVINALDKALGIPTHPHRLDLQFRLRDGLIDLYQRTGVLGHLDRAICVSNTILTIVPDRTEPLINLGTHLGMRFQKTDSMVDLNHAVDILESTLASTTLDDYPRAVLLNSLGLRLGDRSVRTDSINDLDRSIDVLRMAINATPQDKFVDLASRLSNLGIQLGNRFGRIGSICDLNRAIEVSEAAIEATPEDYVDRASRVNNLGTYYNRRFEQNNSIDDSNRAIELAKIAVNASPLGHVDRASRLINLGNYFGHRFKQTGLIGELNYAIDMLSEVMNEMPQDHPDNMKLAHDLGLWLRLRYNQTQSTDDLNLMLSSYKKGWSCRAAPPHDRIRVAYEASHILALLSEWEESNRLLEEAIELLPAVSPRSLKHTDKQHMLTDFVGLASAGAAVSLNAGKGAEHALRLLELGRGIVAGLLMDMRIDLSDLQEKYPTLADEFVSLRDELDSPVAMPGDDMSTWEPQTKRRREADEKFDDLILKIRAKPEFRDFLLLPGRNELMAAADPDPIIVVNSSQHRCDAFIIESSQIRVLRLSGLKQQDVMQWTRDLRSSRETMAMVLESLWNEVCRPCLDALGYEQANSSDPPHVWWVPTGLLSQLPLHAAGIHVSGSTETVLDRVMSSYAPSIKALVHGRRRRTKPSSDHALLVAMHETPGNGTLPFAEDEVNILSNLCPSLQLKPIRPVLHKSDIIEHLSECQIFHFAGHGYSNPMEPSQSYLLLKDWKTDPLTVGDLRDCQLHNNPPFLSYLSACSTGSNKANELVDEAIHLVSAFQLAGFRHVIGTLWEVSDQRCVDVAKVLYESLRDETMQGQKMTDAAVCRGLHRAVKLLRDGRKEGGEERDATVVESKARRRKLKNFDWVPYIHYGV
ncbi:CHAT domain-containing protein [Annulohypoxylon bovei var. microspora]|nr:CHAT domain-containing protein [Annulohypoxylon bovei var. microspora]